jgi:sugar phosphate permease
VANWFPARRFALLTGLIVTLGMLGAIGGEAPLAHLIARIGWRDSMYALGCVGLVLSLVIFLVIKDSPHGKTIAPKTSFRLLGSEFLQVLKNKQLWLVALYGGLMYLPTPTLCGLWGVPFLKAGYQVSDTVAAGMISIVLVGWAIGSPIWGAMSDRLARRILPMVIGAVVAPLTMLIITYCHFSSLILLQIFLFCFGLFSSAFLPSFSIAREISKPAYCATSLGFMNMMNMIGVAIAQPFLGKILDLLWNGQMANGVPVYAFTDYKIAITLMVTLMMVPLLLLIFIKDSHAKQST